MSGTEARSHSRFPGLSQPGFDLVFGYVYTGLAVNICMAVANAPLMLALVLVRDPAQAWPFFLLISPTVAPSIAAAFAAFEASNAGGTSPFREFWRGWRRCLRPALVVGLATAALALLVGVDLAATAARPAGALLAPVLLVVLAFAIVSAVLVLTGIATRDAAATVSVRALAKASVYLVARRWALGLLTLGTLVGACAFVLAQPVFGPLLGVAPLLFIAFSNARATLATPLRPRAKARVRA